MTSAENLLSLCTAFSALALISNLLMSYFIERTKEQMTRVRKWYRYGRTAIILAIGSLLDMFAALFGVTFLFLSSAPDNGTLTIITHTVLILGSAGMILPIVAIVLFAGERPSLLLKK